MRRLDLVLTVLDQLRCDGPHSECISSLGGGVEWVRAPDGSGGRDDGEADDAGEDGAEDRVSPDEGVVGSPAAPQSGWPRIMATG